jgi:hypothetical protein
MRVFNGSNFTWVAISRKGVKKVLYLKGAFKIKDKCAFSLLNTGGYAKKNYTNLKI